MSAEEDRAPLLASQTVSDEFVTEPPHFSQPRTPDDLNVPWGVWDLVLLVVVAFVVSLVAGLIAVVALSLLGFAPTAIQTSPHLKGILGVILQIVLDLGLLGYLALRLRVGFDVPFWQTIGWRKLETGIISRGVAYFGLVLSGAIISLLVVAASNLNLPKTSLPIDSVIQDRASAFLFLLMAVLLAPIVEETIFRGYLYPVVARSWGLVPGIAVTGALFGLLHGPQLWGAWWQIALLVGVGIIFSWVRALTQTVVASYFLHLGYNSLQLLAFLLSTHFLKSIPGPN